MKKKSIRRYIIICLLPVIFLSAACVGMAVSAQEYFSIGMAYYDLGRYDEAERWLNRARQADRTMTASQYNLGRIAFETGNFNDAARHFEDILRRDPNNILALRAAAYTRIRTGDIDIAEKHYYKLLSLVPESFDDGYNHALVLYAMERYNAAEEVLEKYPFSLLDNRDMLLLYARSQKAQGKVEAIDNYVRWLNDNSDSRVRYEYAQLLEEHELYARALEEYRQILSETIDAGSGLEKSELHFSLARLLLIADGESGEGITELETAISEGFSDIEAVEELQENQNVSAANRDRLRTIVNNMQRALEALEQEQEQEQDYEQFDQGYDFFPETDPEGSYEQN